MTPKNDRPLTMNDQPDPTSAIQNPATAGPTIRPAL